MAFTFSYVQGMFNLNFSCPRDPEVVADYEFSLRTWWMGFEVTHVHTG